MKSAHFKAWCLAGLMMAVAVLCVWLKPKPDPVFDARSRVPLEQIFPSRLGDWRSDIDPSVFVRPAADLAKRFQMYDQVLERTYVNSGGRRLMLSVAYGRLQSVGLQMHRPEVCYQAGGFSVNQLESTQLNVQGRALTVTRLLAQMEGRPEPVTYWQLLGNEVLSDSRDFKLKQLSLGLRGRLLDGMLVRISSIDADKESAYRLQAQFVSELADAMSPEYRQRVFGQTSP